MIVQQAMASAANPNSCTVVLADDTDIFVLLLFYYGHCSIRSALYMQSLVYGRSSVDIRASFQKHRSKAPDLPRIHAISGCDTVACFYGIGKVTALKVASEGYQLGSLGCETAALSDVSKQATSFIAKCYGVSPCSSMTDCRLVTWAKKTGKGSRAPKLCSLPPTPEGFEPNILRAHFQVAYWMCVLTGERPTLDPLQCGWDEDETNKCLIPKYKTNQAPDAPDNVLKLVRCGCASDRPCQGANVDVWPHNFHVQYSVHALVMEMHA